VALLMELFLSMISERNQTLQSLKIDNPWINIQMPFGIFNGSTKERAEKDKVSSVSAETVELLNGQ
jgi:hypothetical protein